VQEIPRTTRVRAGGSEIPPRCAKSALLRPEDGIRLRVQHPAPPRKRSARRRARNPRPGRFAVRWSELWTANSGQPAARFSGRAGPWNRSRSRPSSHRLQRRGRHRPYWVPGRAKSRAMGSIPWAARNAPNKRSVFATRHPTDRPQSSLDCKRAMGSSGAAVVTYNDCLTLNSVERNSLLQCINTRQFQVR